MKFSFDQLKFHFNLKQVLIEASSRQDLDKSM